MNWLTRANRWLVAGLAIGVFLAEHFTPTAAHLGVAVGSPGTELEFAL